MNKLNKEMALRQDLIQPHLCQLSPFHLQETIPNFSMIVPLEAAFLGKQHVFLIIFLNLTVKNVGVELIKAYQGIIYRTQTQIYCTITTDYTYIYLLLFDILYIHVYVNRYFQPMVSWFCQMLVGFAKILIDPGVDDIGVSHLNWRKKNPQR